MMSLQLSASLLGGIVSNGQILCPGPGHSRNDRSLAVRFEDGDFVIHSFAGQDFRECRDHVRETLGLGKAGPMAFVPLAPLSARPAVEDRDRIASAERIWLQSRRIADTPAEAYLNGRGLVVPDDAPDVLRFLQACPFMGKAVPAMVAAMVDARTSEFRGVHRTRLNPKLKAMLGPARGAVVKLTPDDDVENGLHICEGIETGLALLGMGFRPLWACMSAVNLAAFPVLSGIESLTIFADNDASRTGEMAANKCAARWRNAGLEAQIWITPDTDSDFAEVAA